MPDIIAALNHIMGNNPDPFNFEAADVNSDGVINVLDVIFIVNIIMGVSGLPCPGEPSVIYEGLTYNTVLIGDQCWFKDNMNIGTMINSNTSGQLQTDNGIIEKFCYLNNPLQCDIYGGLYQWNEAMQYETAEGVQGICPNGWHLPTDSEWKILEGTVDSQYPVGDPEWDDMFFRGLDAGGNLKETGFTHWKGPNLGATNASGFTALPGGYRYNENGLFYSLGDIGYFWTSTQMNLNGALDRRLYWDNAMIARFNSNKEFGFSVRCLLDD